MALSTKDSDKPTLAASGKQAPELRFGLVKDHIMGTTPLE
jgi:hypothetical protein